MSIDLLANPVTRRYLDRLALHTQGINFLGLPTLWLEFTRLRDPLLRHLFVAPALGREEVDAEQFSQKAPREQMHPLQALEQHRRLVILGAPGAGKSTLAQWLVWWLSNGMGDMPAWARGLLPIHISFKDLPLAGIKRFEFLLSRHGVHGGEPGRAFADLGDQFQSLASEGQVLFVLDGYDELAAQLMRHVRHAIQGGMRQWPRCRWLITSRSVGYADAKLSEVSSGTPAWIGEPPALVGAWDIRGQRDIDFKGITELHLLPFDNARIHSLAHAWHGLIHSSEEAVREAANRFVEAVSANEATLTLARTPNFLVMMAMLFRQVRLPDGRAELYDLISGAYLESIDAARYKGQAQGVADGIRLNTKRQWLAHIAFEMQVRRSGGEGRELLFSRTEMLQWLATAIQQTHPELGADYAEPYFHWLQARSGLIVARSEEQFGFVHLSFQEYFAARHVVDQFKGPRWASHQSAAEAIEAGLNPAVNRASLWHWAGQAHWREMLVFATELLATQTGWPRPWCESLFGKDFRRLHRADVSDEVPQLAVRLLLSPHAGLGKLTESIFEALLCWEQAADRDLNPIRGKILTRLLLSESWAGRLWKNWQWRTEINLSYVDIEDFSPLWSITKLQALNLRLSLVSDLAFLESISSLLSLNVGGTKVSDLAPLTSHSGLLSLVLAATSISDLSRLAAFPGLKSLNLIASDVVDLGPLTALSNLQSLALSGACASDTASLTSFRSLRSLRLRHAGIDNLAPLTKLHDLLALDLNFSTVANFAPFAAFSSALRSLDLSSTNISEVSTLTALSGLRTLDLSHTSISDISPLAVLMGLQVLNLNDTPISDPSPLAALTGLQSLNLNNTPISDLAPLAKLNCLKSLSLGGTAISDLLPLASLSSLRSLDLGSTAVRDLTQLKALTGLQSLDLSGNSIGDLSPLTALTGLQSLDLRRASVGDLSPLAELQSLQWVALPESFTPEHGWRLYPLLAREVEF